MIKSMTAFSRTEEEIDDLQTVIEIRSVNSRYLDISTRIPYEFHSLEEKIKRVITEKINRGRVELKMTIKDNSSEKSLFEINKEKAEAYHQVLIQLKDRFKLEAEIPLNLMVGAEGVIQAATRESDVEVFWKGARPCLETALIDLEEMRRVEGDAIEKDLKGRLQTIEAHLNNIEQMALEVPHYHQKRLAERIANLTRGTLEIDSARLAQEAAFLADKSDISEEIVRVKSHLSQFYNIMGDNESAGRKLIFLLQEIHREFNTMGSKADNADITIRVIEIKSELEKIREQALNVE